MLPGERVRRRYPSRSSRPPGSETSDDSSHRSSRSGSRPHRDQYRHLGWQELQDLGNTPRGGKLEVHRREARDQACRLIHGSSSGFVREKIASGIILVRTPDQTLKASDRSGGRQEFQAILVRGRLSYAFCEFAHGKYDRDRLETVGQLIRNMSIEERLVLATLNFDEIWGRIWARKHMRGFSWRTGGTSHARKLQILRQGWPAVDYSRDTLYAHRREKFHAAWLIDEKSSQLLKRLLNEAAGVGQDRWEYPKGKRLDRTESDLSCAIREFREETQIPLANIRILPGFDRVEKYVHMNVLYINTYYLAVLVAPFGDPAKFIRLSNADQVSEVADVRWLGLADMRLVSGPAGRDLSAMGRAAFRYVRAYNKGTAPRLYTPPFDVNAGVTPRPIPPKNAKMLGRAKSAGGSKDRSRVAGLPQRRPRTEQGPADRSDAATRVRRRNPRSLTNESDRSARVLAMASPLSLPMPSQLPSQPSQLPSSPSQLPSSPSQLPLVLPQLQIPFSPASLDEPSPASDGEWQLVQRPLTKKRLRWLRDHSGRD
jgi:8-oxo-dGTP pyrophosphatase MutT (NUDIX family)